MSDGKHVIGYSPAYILCMKTNPSLSLIKFLAGHNPRAFVDFCSSQLNDEFAYEEGEHYEIYALHLAADHSESVTLLQILLQLDKLVTKKRLLYGIMTNHTTHLVFFAKEAATFTSNLQ
jgi:hypothetical protein